MAEQVSKADDKWAELCSLLGLDPWETTPEQIMNVRRLGTSGVDVRLEEMAREIAQKGYHWLGHGEETAVKAITEIIRKHIGQPAAPFVPQDEVRDGVRYLYSTTAKIVTPPKEKDNG